MALNVAQKLIETHLVSGEMTPGDEIALRIDQTLTQDATGTMVMLELEALGLERARTEVSVQYVDHNLLQADSNNADDHEFLRSACQRFGLWFSKAGNGVSHPTHMQRFGVPGKTMVGSDSHTPAAGSLGMLAIGLGGIEVARAIAGEPIYLQMPQIWGVHLTGELRPWVSAKDVILELLRRHGVKGGVNRIIEYHGPGLAGLSAMDRHVIANMGAELGATSTVFPADDRVAAFLRAEQREGDFTGLLADDDATYDVARGACERDQRLDHGRVGLLCDVVRRISVGEAPGEVTLPLLGAEERGDPVVGGEHGAGGAELGSHVRDHVPVHRGQSGEPGPVVLDDPVHASLDAMPAQQLQDHVLGTDPGPQLPGQVNTPDLRHLQVDRLTRDRPGHLDPAQSDREHAERPGGRGVAVRADHRLAGYAEPLHVRRMRDTVSCLGEPQPEPLARRAQELVVIRVVAVCLQQVVVDVLH